MRIIIAKVFDKLISLITAPFNFVLNFLLFKIQNVHYIEFPKIRGFVILKNRGIIKIGKNMTISSSRYGNPVGGYEKTALFCSPNGRIIIGDNVSISSTVIFSQNNITVEDYVMIGGGTEIWDTDFHPTNLNDRKSHVITKIKTKPVLLKKGCFIGANSIILKGAVIGRNSIIGAGSVVSKFIPDNEIWAGNPVRFIKKIDE